MKSFECRRCGTVKEVPDEYFSGVIQCVIGGEERIIGVILPEHEHELTCATHGRRMREIA